VAKKSKINNSFQFNNFLNSNIMFYSSNLVQRMGASDHSKNRASSKSLKNRVKLFIFILCISGISGISVYAQDVITMRNGDEIKAKVTEITSSEIKYKRFENLDGPTVSVRRADVTAIVYENGTREAISASMTAAAPATFGIYANLGGLVFYGPTIGAELTINRRLVFDFAIGFLPGLSFNPISQLFDAKGVMGLAGFKYFNERPKGGFYFGPFIGFYSEKGHWQVTNTRTGETRKEPDEFTGFLTLGNVGYKFTTKSGLFFRTGVYLGSEFYSSIDGSSGVDFAYMLDLSIGITF